MVSRYQHSAGPREGTQNLPMLLRSPWSHRDEKAVPVMLLKSKWSSLFRNSHFQLPFVSMEGSSEQGSWRGLDLGRNLVWAPEGALVWSRAVTCPLQLWWGQDRKITFHLRTKGPLEGDGGGGCLLGLREKWRSGPSAKRVERGDATRRLVCPEAILI